MFLGQIESFKMRHDLGINQILLERRVSFLSKLDDRLSRRIGDRIHVGTNTQMVRRL